MPQEMQGELKIYVNDVAPVIEGSNEQRRSHPWDMVVPFALLGLSLAAFFSMLFRPTFGAVASVGMLVVIGLLARQAWGQFSVAQKIVMILTLVMSGLSIIAYVVLVYHFGFGEVDEWLRILSTPDDDVRIFPCYNYDPETGCENM